MSYSYSFLPESQNEYEEAISWYNERSLLAATGFIEAIDAALTLICNDPAMWRNLYEDYHELGLKKYPYNIVYSIEPHNKRIVIKSIYHQSRDPERKYKR